MNIVKQEPWSFTLYEREGKFFLSVLCGGVGLFELNIPLTCSESESIQNDSSSLDRLVEDVRNRPGFYKSRSINFDK